MKKKTLSDDVPKTKTISPLIFFFRAQFGQCEFDLLSYLFLIALAVEYGLRSKFHDFKS